ncbi:cell wall metabolism sensor histidine kinase WalK [Paenibacillus thiaminolyticus]|uniref:sensor histidine kinase n=1 Tax=Paenibacillus thiaminolyticus TaxID=49283 RepID=UPI00217599C4|nr:sensor histidine kinase [Paenibacillus thiaminolyticus]
MEFEPIAQEYGVQLHCQLEPVPALVQVDSEKIIPALDNLLLNALKFSIRPGQIHVSFQSGNGHLSVAIENEGKPITAEQEKHLFERFYKADDSRTAHAIQSGSGLGLSIAKNIVELHGGTIKLRHEDGHFTFTVRLPKR